MHGDFRPLIHPGTDAQAIDVVGTRAYRQRMHQAIRAQQRAHPGADLPIPPDPGSPAAIHQFIDTRRREAEVAAGVSARLVGIEVLLQALSSQLQRLAELVPATTFAASGARRHGL